jgi:hypothetical protein
MPLAHSRIDHWALLVRICPAASRPSTSSAGTTPNKKDSQDTVDTLIADLRGTKPADVAVEHSEELNQWLLHR